VLSHGFRITGEPELILNWREQAESLIEPLSPAHDFEPVPEKPAPEQPLR